MKNRIDIVAKDITTFEKEPDNDIADVLLYILRFYTALSKDEIFSNKRIKGYHFTYPEIYVKPNKHFSFKDLKKVWNNEMYLVWYEEN